MLSLGGKLLVYNHYYVLATSHWITYLPVGWAIPLVLTYFTQRLTFSTSRNQHQYLSIFQDLTATIVMRIVKYFVWTICIVYNTISNIECIE